MHLRNNKEVTQYYFEVEKQLTFLKNIFEYRNSICYLLVNYLLWNHFSYLLKAEHKQIWILSHFLVFFPPDFRYSWCSSFLLLLLLFFFPAGRAVNTSIIFPPWEMQLAFSWYSFFFFFFLNKCKSGLKYQYLKLFQKSQRWRGEEILLCWKIIILQ